MRKAVHGIMPVLMRLRTATLRALALNRGQQLSIRAAAVRCLCAVAPLEIGQGKSMADRRRSVRAFYRL